MNVWYEYNREIYNLTQLLCVRETEVDGILSVQLLFRDNVAATLKGKSFEGFKKDLTLL